MSKIIPTIPLNGLPRVHSQLGRRGMLQTNTTMVAMMEPVAEQYPNEISWTNTRKVQWEKIMSPIGPTTQLNVVS
jgi:hypothetical protein